jgi:hypothetical protein
MGYSSSRCHVIGSLLESEDTHAALVPDVLDDLAEGERGLPRGRRPQDQRELVLATTLRGLVQTGAPPGSTRGDLRDELAPQGVPFEQVDGGVVRGPEEGLGELRVPLVVLEKVVGVLVSEVVGDNPHAARRQQFGHLLRRDLPRLVGIEGEHDLLVALEVLDVLREHAGRRLCPVGQGDHRPVLQHRADRGRVDLALGDEDALTPRLEPVTTEQEVLRLPVDTTLAVLVPVLLERDGPVDRVPILRDLGDQRAPRVGGLAVDHEAQVACGIGGDAAESVGPGEQTSGVEEG